MFDHSILYIDIYFIYAFTADAVHSDKVHTPTDPTEHVATLPTDGDEITAFSFTDDVMTPRMSGPRPRTLTNTYVVHEAYLAHCSKWGLYTCHIQGSKIVYVKVFQSVSASVGCTQRLGNPVTTSRALNVIVARVSLTVHALVSTFHQAPSTAMETHSFPLRSMSKNF